MSLEYALIQTSFMRRRFESVASDDRVNQLFPERAGFGVTLERMLNGEHHVTRDGDTVASEVSIGVLIVDDHEGGLIWWRRVCVCVRGIHFQDRKPFVRAQGKE